jgi:hypothetical protein
MLTASGEPADSESGDRFCGGEAGDVERIPLRGAPRHHFNPHRSSPSPLKRQSHQILDFISGSMKLKVL